MNIIKCVEIEEGCVEIEEGCVEIEEGSESEFLNKAKKNNNLKRDYKNRLIE